MKTIITSIVLLFLASCVFATEEVKINSKVSEVTVFFKGAQVMRTGEVNLKKGTTKIVFSNVSPLINPKSLQAKCGTGVDILDVKHRVIYPNPGDLVIAVLPESVNAGLQRTNDSLLRQQLKYELLDSRLQNLYAEKNLLTQSELMTKKASDTMPSLKLALMFYREKLDDIESRIEDVRWKSHLCQKRLAELNKKMIEFQNYNQGNTESKPLKIIHEVIVTVDTDLPQTTTLTMSYLVSNAGWIPGYDLKAEEDQSKLALTYKASVYQDTDEDWKDVTLSLSTFNYDVSGKLPELAPKKLSYKTAIESAQRKYQQAGRQKAVWDNNFCNQATFSASHSNDASVNLASSFDPATCNYTFRSLDQVSLATMEFNLEIPALRNQTVEVFTPKSIPEYNFINDSYLNTRFNIKKKYDILSDATETIVIIKETDISADFAHFLVPKMDNSAFLVTRINNWEELNLLKANANIYMKNTFVGETGIDPAQISDTMQLSLGRDNGLFCIRKKVKDEVKTGTFSKNIEQIEEYEITIKNTNNHEMKIFIKDQIPVTEEQGIEIVFNNPSKGELDSETGEILWEVELKPKQVKTLKFGFSVTYNKEKNLAAQ